MGGRAQVFALCLFLSFDPVFYLFYTSSVDKKIGGPRLLSAWYCDPLRSRRNLWP